MRPSRTFPDRPLLPPILLLLLGAASLPLLARGAQPRCAANEILLHNGTCHCPFFRFGEACLRHRYQTTVNATLDAVIAHSRHLLGSSDQQPLLITIDATNAEAMQALADSLSPLVRGGGTVVTRVVDSVDTLVGGDASATLEIVNASMNASSSVLTLTVDCRLPAVDFFFLYLHLGSGAAEPPCPPFVSGCCRGDMLSPEFLTVGVDCTANNPLQQMDAFVRAWNGRYAPSPGADGGGGEERNSREVFSISIPLNRSDIPSTIENGARVVKLGLGMVVFGKLSQNTESRVELQLNSSSVATSYGQFRYSFIEYTRLQLEGCGGVLFAHLTVKAANVTGVRSLRFQSWDGGDWLVPPGNCSSTATGPGVANPTAVLLGDGTTPLAACNVSITGDFVDVYLSMKGLPFNRTATVYALLQRGAAFARVIAKTDSTVLQHCNAPLRINTSAHDAFDIEVMQGGVVKYSGPPRLVELTDVAALTLRILSKSAIYAYAFDNVSVVYSLVDSAQILQRMPDGKVTPELEELCDAGNVCLIESLLLNGQCQTMDKCEQQGEKGLFIMPLYPWGRATLNRKGTYTVMVSEIKETVIPESAAGPPPGSASAAGMMRRLLGWMLRR